MRGKGGGGGSERESKYLLPNVKEDNLLGQNYGVNFPSR